MCLELRIVAASPADISTGLELLDIDVLPDTIEQYWTPLERAEVLVWIAGMHAARKLDDNSLVPNMPEVLVPFYDASRQAREEEELFKQYLGIEPCGCCTAAMVDDETTTPQSVKDFELKMAMTGRRVLHIEYNPKTMPCPLVFCNCERQAS